MLLTLLGVLIVVGLVWLVLYVLNTYFPALAAIWRAAIIASLVLMCVRALGAWLCGLVCR